MLTEKDFKILERQAIDLYSDLELEIIKEIAERIANVGYANTVVYNDAIILQEMGYLYEDIVAMVARYNETNASQIRKIFEEAGIKSLKRDDEIYKLAGLEPTGISYSMQQLMQRRANQTAFNLKSLTGTTASQTQIQFIEAVNNAYLEVSTGVKSYSQSITDIVKSISKKGAQVQYPSGYKISIEAATRMNILTGVNQMASEMQLDYGKELGWDLYEVSAHSGARPEHAEWQGKVYNEQGLYDICGYGTVTGLCGANCRHTFKPYFRGSGLTYTAKELREYRTATVEYNGKKISKYEATQIQRKMERQIRQNKKDIAGLQGILTSNVADNKLIEETKSEIAKKTLIYNSHKSALEDFVKQTDAVIDNTRLSIGTSYNYSQISTITKLTNNFNNSNIIGMKVNNTKITQIGEHIISQTYARGLKVRDVQETLQNPIKYGKIRKDNSQIVYGETCAVVMNVDTGKLITTYAKKTKRE